MRVTARGYIRASERGAVLHGEYEQTQHRMLTAALRVQKLGTTSQEAFWESTYEQD